MAQAHARTLLSLFTRNTKIKMGCFQNQNFVNMDQSSTSHKTVLTLIVMLT